jgi:hypothetical protein
MFIKKLIYFMLKIDKKVNFLRVSIYHRIKFNNDFFLSISSRSVRPKCRHLETEALVASEAAVMVA